MEFRSLHTGDRDICCAMMKSTWQFETVIPGYADYMPLYRLVFDYYRKQSTYAQVAIDPVHGNLPAGFLLAGSGRNHRAGLHRLYAYMRFAAFALHVLLRPGRCALRESGAAPGSFIRAGHAVFFSYVMSEAALKNGVETDGEILAFFVADKARGAHVGSALLDAYMSYAREHGMRTIRLVTDSDCNYAFYDRRGFVRIKTQPGILGDTGYPPSGHRFLYCRYL